jgi:hypothetical protein
MNFWKVMNVVFLVLLLMIVMVQQAAIRDLTDAINAINQTIAEQHLVNQHVQESLRMRPIATETLHLHYDPRYSHACTLNLFDLNDSRAVDCTPLEPKQ